MKRDASVSVKVPSWTRYIVTQPDGELLALEVEPLLGNAGWLYAFGRHQTVAQLHGKHMPWKQSKVSVQ